jgi:hypothetical protein
MDEYVHKLQEMAIGLLRMIQDRVGLYHDIPVNHPGRFDRRLPIPADMAGTFFLWGPRQTGKRTFLLDRFPGRGDPGRDGLIGPLLRAFNYNPFNKTILIQ